jgi:hypothetical protein
MMFTSLTARESINSLVISIRYHFIEVEAAKQAVLPGPITFTFKYRKATEFEEFLTAK